MLASLPSLNTSKDWFRDQDSRAKGSLGFDQVEDEDVTRRRLEDVDD